MRKVSLFMGLPVISSKDKSILGKINGVLCDNRLKSIEYFQGNFENQGGNSRFFIKPQSAKIKNNNSILLSKNLYIKNDKDIDLFLYKSVPLNNPVFSSDGENIGELLDVTFDETRKNTISIITTESEISVSRIASVSDMGIVLLPKGQKRLRNSKPIIKPNEDFKVELYNAEDAPKNNTHPIRLISNYHFLIGRVVTRNIYSFSHSLIIKKGTLITYDIILTAHKNNKLVELTLYSKA